ncbi:Protein NDR1 [Cardamine amara subsp. amara]|uniref:Protein NDR1 n=1 Tax=Cardamine amara subsp. amara TaxID=228776 RepID=A0ABD1AEV9_CARAN
MGRGLFYAISIHLLYISSLVVLFLWFVTLVNHIPRCSIHYFYIPSLNKSLNSPHNTTLNFMLRLKNINAAKGIYYDDLHLSFSTIFNNSSSSSLLVANYTVPRFYQGHEKKAKKWGQILPLNNHTVFRAIFRVDLKTQVKYKFMFWKTRRYKFEASVNLEVNEEGATKVKNKEDGIKMKKSDSSPPKLTSFHLFFSIIFVFMNLLVFLDDFSFP